MPSGWTDNHSAVLFNVYSKQSRQWDNIISPNLVLHLELKVMIKFKETRKGGKKAVFCLRVLDSSYKKVCTHHIFVKLSLLQKPCDVLVIGHWLLPQQLPLYSFFCCDIDLEIFPVYKESLCMTVPEWTFHNSRRSQRVDSRGNNVCLSSF